MTAARRTQIQSTAAQRKQLEGQRRREQRAALESTFGSLPNADVPSSGEWEVPPPQLTD